MINQHDLFLTLLNFLHAPDIAGRRITDKMTNTTSISHITPALKGMQLLGFIFLTILVFFTTFGNILICLAILRTRTLRTSSNLLIVNMAFGDILYSWSTLPLSMVLLCFRSNWPLGKTGNVVFDATWLAFLVLSFINVIFIAFERYVAVAKPFTYKTIATKQRMVCCCLCCWVYVFLLTFTLSFAFRNPNGDIYIFLIPGIAYYLVLIFHSASAFVSVPVLYAKILFIARKHKLEIMKQKDVQMRHSFYLQMKATRTIGLVLLLFFAVWLPFLINQFVDFEGIYRGKWDVVNSLTCYITYCNGSVNIFVYSWRSRQIRNVILNLLRIEKFPSCAPRTPLGV